MGLLRTAFRAVTYTVTGSAVGAGAGLAYLRASSDLVDLTKDDPMFRSKTYARYNPRGNPPLADVVIKRVPLSKIRPELRDDEVALTQEFNRGAWSRWAFWGQSKLQQRYDRPSDGAAEDNLWTVSQIKDSDFKEGTRLVNHFEVVRNDGKEVWVRCGGTPLEPGLRASDGLVCLSATINKEKQEAEFRYKSALFSSGAPKPEDPANAVHAIPTKIVYLHQWYVRALTQAGYGRCKA